jgi:hypothetical protein
VPNFVPASGIPLPSLHLFAKCAGPAVIRLTPYDLPGDLIDFHTFAQPANVGRGLVKIRFFGIDFVDIQQQFFDSLYKGLVGRAFCQNQRFDHGRVYGTGVVRFQNWEPVPRWQIVPGR